MTDGSGQDHHTGDGERPPAESPDDDEGAGATTRGTDVGGGDRDALVDAVADGIYRLDEDGRFVDVNDSIAELTGYSREELLDRHVSTVLDEVDAGRVDSAIQALLETDSDTVTIDLSVRTGSGDVVPCEVRTSLVTEDGAFRGTVGVVRDASERFDALDPATDDEEAPREDEQRFRSLVDAVEEYAIFMLDPDGRIVTWNEGAQRLKGYDHEDVVGEHLATFYTEDDVAAGVPEGNLATAREEGSVEDEGWRVRADGSQFWATVTLTAIRDEDGNLRGFAKVTRDMTDRREHERRLQEERDVVEQILDTSPIGIAVVDPDGRVSRANERMSDIVGRSGDPQSYTIGDVTMYDAASDPIPRDERPIERVLASGEPVYHQEVRIDPPEGPSRWLNIDGAPITDEDGDVLRVVATASDVTQLKEQAAKLERQRDELESELAEVFSRIDDAFFALDDEWRFTHLNERGREVIENAGEAETVPQELVGCNIWEVIPGAVDTAFYDRFHEAMTAQEAVTFEAYFEPVETWFEARAYPSESGLSVYFSDVTERKAREQELERYETIVETINEGVYVVDGEGRFTWVNSAYEELTGYPAGELIGAHVSTVVDEATTESVQGIEAQLRAGDRIAGTLEADLQTADGGSVPAAATFAMLSSEEGEANRVGVVRDVSERKERERELERYEALLEESKDVNVVVGPDGTFEYVTPSVTNVFGYDREELVGEVGFEYIHPDDRPEAMEEFARMVDNPGYEPRIEYRFQHADGSWITLEAMGRNLLEDPDVGGIVVYTRDVTERKQYEETLATLYDSARELFTAETSGAVGETVVETVTDVLDLGGVVLYLHDETEDVLYPASKSNDSRLMREEFPVVPPDDSSITGHVYQSGELERHEDITASSHLQVRPEDTEMRGGVFVPLGDHGVLIVGSRDVGAFDDQVERLVALLATNAEAALDRVEREQELEAQRERYRRLVEVAPVAIAAYDADGDIAYVNDAGVELLGADGAASVVGESAADLVHPDDREGAAERMRRVLEERETSPPRETRILTRDGDVRDAVVTSVPITLDGEPGGQVVLTDITERKERERELAKREETLADVYRITADKEASLDEKLDRLLEIGRETLGVGVGALSRVDGDDYVFEVVQDPDGDTEPGDVVPLSETNCERAIVEEQTLVLEDIAAQAPELAERAGFTEQGISCYLGTPITVEDDVYGTFCFYDRDVRADSFTEWEVTLVELMGRWISYEHERIRSQRELERQRERLAALNHLNEVVREISSAAIDQSTREEIEATVCEALAASGSYEFAWIGEVDAATDTVALRAEAGVEGYLDDLTISVDPGDDRSRGPTGKAVTTKEIAVTQDVLEDSDDEQWSDVAREYGFRSSAAIPIVHEETLYGVLNVYASRPEAFDGEERRVIGQLGEVVGHAIAAIERKHALTSDELVEIDFSIEGVFDAMGVDASEDERITIDRSVPLGDDEFLVYGSTTEAGVALVEAMVESVPHWESMRTVGEEPDGVRFEAHLEEPPVLTALAAHGGYLEEARIQDGDYTMTVQVPPSVEVRQLVDLVQEAYPNAEMRARRQVTRADDGAAHVSTAFETELTDRQRTVLETAYFAGYFDWPRKSSGEDISETLDISPATFSQHLRRAENCIFGALVGERTAE